MNFWVAFLFWSCYELERYCFVRFYRKMPVYNMDFMHAIVNWCMPGALVIHMCWSYFTFGISYTTVEEQRGPPYEDSQHIFSRHGGVGNGMAHATLQAKLASFQASVEQQQAMLDGMTSSLFDVTAALANRDATCAIARAQRRVGDFGYLALPDNLEQE